MPTAENKVLIRRLYSLLDKGDIDDAARLFANDFRDHALGLDLEDLLDSYRILQQALADVSFQVEDLLAEDDKVAVRATVTGQRVLKPIELRGTMIFRIEDGKITERWGNQESFDPGARGPYS